MSNAGQCTRFAFVLVAMGFVYSGENCFGQSWKLRDAPAPLAESEETVTEDAEAAPGTRGFPSTLPTFPSINTSFIGRAAAIIDSTRLADFSSGSFVPAAIPVEGEAFHEFGERALVQGTGSAIKWDSRPAIADGELQTEATLIVSEMNFPDANENFGLSVRAHAQYRNFLIGLTETAFADSDILLPMLDQGGPNGYATILKPDGTGGQGRVSYFLYPFGSTVGEGLIGNVSLEMPTPEIRYTSGTTIPTTFSSFSHVPDFIMTWKYSEGVTDGKKFDPDWHVQAGTVVRDLGLKNGDKSIDDSTLGWGFQISGSTAIDYPRQSDLRDAIGASVVFGEGIGHYINDLHTQTISSGARGHDAVLIGDNIEALEAQSYYVGYAHRWSSEWQTSLGYSRVNLATPPDNSPLAYRHGDYAVVNLVYSHEISKDDVESSPPPSKKPTLIAGIEYLFGRKEVVNGNSADAHRMMCVLQIVK